MADAIQQPENQALVTSHTGPLTKSLVGLRNLVPIGPEPIALMFTNEYTDMVWPSDKLSMTLKGASKDRVNAKTFLEKFTPGIRVEGTDSNVTLRRHIKDWVGAVAGSESRLAVAYFQGHSEGELGPNRYVTGDHDKSGTLEGFTAEKLLKMFSKLRTMSMVITDFCNSGNIYRLRFRLMVSLDGERYRWLETDEWRKDNAGAPKYRIDSPMLHIAASLHSQQAYETEKRGGYLTNSLATAEPKTLPQLLVHLRRGVESHLNDAKAHPKGPLCKDATQSPQIFSTCKLPLDDPEIFDKIYRGNANSFYSNFD